jgi:hypothetical protein
VGAQVDCDLTTVGWVDRLLGLIKNLGHHSHLKAGGKGIVVNKTSKRPTRKRSKRNTKENRWYMTNPKQSKRDTEKNPWAMDNPNYKFRKRLLSDGDLKKCAPFTRKIHKFYMQRGTLDDDSHIMVALRPETSAWPPRWSNGLQKLPVQLSDLYYLFNLDALDLILLHCFIL